MIFLFESSDSGNGSNDFPAPYDQLDIIGKYMVKYPELQSEKSRNFDLKMILFLFS